jgi:hypothetical protein
VAQLARGPVAIVHRRHTHEPLELRKWIVAVLDRSPSSHAVFETAINEARLRRAPVLAVTSWSTSSHEHEEDLDVNGLAERLQRYLDDTQHEQADVEVCAIPRQTTC